MDSETLIVAALMICKLLGKEKTYPEVEKAFNEAIKEYRHHDPLKG
jgi:hypothetical protein